MSSSFHQTGNEPTTSSSAASDNGAPPPPAAAGRSGAAAQSRQGLDSPWIRRLRHAGSGGSHGRVRSPRWELQRREERSSSSCGIRTWDLGGGNNLPEFRTPDVGVARVSDVGERNNILSSSSSSGKFVENFGDRSLEASQPVGSLPSQEFLRSNLGDKCSTLFNSPSSSRTPPKVWERCEMENVGVQGRMFRDDVLSSFEHMQRCSAGKGLQKEVEGAFPSTGIENIPWSTELSSFHDTCSTSSSVLIKNVHCNHIGVSRPLVLENNSEANKTAISGEYAHREKILHVHTYNSQTFSGVTGIHKNGQVFKQLEIEDGNSGLSVGASNLAKAANLWTSRFKEKSLPNKAIQEGGNIDGPLQGPSEDVIERSITKDKGVHEIHPYSRKEKKPTLSSFLWLQRWCCSNVRVTQRLMKTCLDPNQKCQSDAVIKGSIDSNTSDASGSLKIVQDPVKDNSVERD